MEFRVSIADPEITFYSENDVDNGVMYQFKVSAVNVYGEGPLSAALSITPATVPEAPYDLVMVSSDS